MSYKIAVFNVFLNFAPILSRAFSHARGHFSVSRVSLDELRKKESLLVVYSQTKIRRKISKYGCPNCPYAGSWHKMLCSFGYSSLDVKKTILCKTL